MPRTMLIVDDNAIARTIASEYVMKSDWNCQFAINGTEAIGALGASDIDAVLLDIFMPQQDGFDVLKWLRKNAPHLPVVVFTEAGAAHNVGYAQMAEKLGAVKGFEKPITSEKIDEAINIIETWINTRAAQTS